MTLDPVMLALLKKYIAETAEGMGAVQGKPGPPGPAGKDGLEYLVFNAFLETQPKLNGSYYIQESDFNRTPVDGENCSGVGFYDGITYYMTGKVIWNSIKSQWYVSVSKVSRLTGQDGQGGGEVDIGIPIYRDLTITNGRQSRELIPSGLGYDKPIVIFSNVRVEKPDDHSGNTYTGVYQIAQHNYHDETVANSFAFFVRELNQTEVAYIFSSDDADRNFVKSELIQSAYSKEAIDAQINDVSTGLPIFKDMTITNGIDSAKLFGGMAFKSMYAIFSNVRVENNTGKYNKYTGIVRIEQHGYQGDIDAFYVRIMSQSEYAYLYDTTTTDKVFTELVRIQPEYSESDIDEKLDELRSSIGDSSLFYVLSMSNPSSTGSSITLDGNNIVGKVPKVNDKAYVLFYNFSLGLFFWLEVVIQSIDLSNINAKITSRNSWYDSDNVCTKSSLTSTLENYVTKADVVNVYKFKGSVPVYENLPTSGQTGGDVYNVEDTGMNYGWVEDAEEENGGYWDPLGGTVQKGTTFTPSVSEAGVISFTNDGGLPNPDPVDIKGPAGEDGVSPTVSVAPNAEQDGTIVSITDAAGTKTFEVLNGENGENGTDGTNGLTPTIGENGNWYIGDVDTGVNSRGDSTVIKEVVLTAAGWSSSLEQSVTVDGVIANPLKQEITPTPSDASRAAYLACEVICVAQAANSLTFSATTLPETDLTVYVSLTSASEGGGGSLDGVPSGVICAWSGTAGNTPDGWALCDGQNGTPDLRDKFVLGAGTTHVVGDTGGSEEVTLTVAQMPSHTHTYFQRMEGNTKQVQSGTINVYPIGGETGKTTSSIGSSQPHDNMPPYYTLAYIMKL